MGDGGFAAAWLLGTAIGVYRQVTRSHRMPVPGNLLALTGFFAALALIGDVIPASKRTVTLLAWGLDLAGVLQLFGSGPLAGQVTAAQASETAASQPAQLNVAPSSELPGGTAGGPF